MTLKWNSKKQGSNQKLDEIRFRSAIATTEFGTLCLILPSHSLSRSLSLRVSVSVSVVRSFSSLYLCLSFPLIHAFISIRKQEEKIYHRTFFMVMVYLFIVCLIQVLLNLFFEILNLKIATKIKLRISKRRKSKLSFFNSKNKEQITHKHNHRYNICVCSLQTIQ